RIEQERGTVSLRCTEQAPHWATPQPYFVPVRPSCSRSTHNSGVSASTSTSRFKPLMLSLMSALSPDALLLPSPGGLPACLPAVRGRLGLVWNRPRAVGPHSAIAAMLPTAPSSPPAQGAAAPRPGPS